MTADANLPMIVQACGRFPLERVRVTYDPVPRPSTAALDAFIAEEWERQLALAKGTQRVLFNGEMLRYVSHAVRSTPSGETFEMTVGPTCYRDFVGTNLYGQRWLGRVGWECFSNAVGTTATILTTDGMICYGRRSERVAFHAGHVHTFGGALEMNDRAADGSVDVFGSLQRELREELGLTPDDLESLDCVGLIRDKEIHQPELLFEARVRLTAAQVRSRWETAEAKDEHAEVVTLEDRAESIELFIKSCDLIAPVAVGALEIHEQLKQSGGVG
jgi:8-oxo-dGTP pyrophosphatase MutT (NUDIX family)